MALPDPTVSQMPMAQSANKLSANATPPLPPLPILPASPAPAPAGAPTPMSGAPMAPGGAYPPPGAPAGPPWKVKQQPDGSSINYLPGQKGDGTDDIIIGVNPAPRLPKALQNPATPGQ